MNIELEKDLKDQETLLPVDRDIRHSYIPPNPLANPYKFDQSQLINQQIEKPSKHIRSLIGNIFLIVYEATFISLYVSDILFYVGEAGIIIICVLGYVFYLCLVLIKNPLFSYFNNINHGHTFKSQFEKYKKAKGHFVFHAECYHYNYTYVNTGKTSYSSRQKVVTHTATEKLTPKTCFDKSKQVGELNTSVDYYFLRNILQFVFANEASRTKYNRLYQIFKKNNTKDSHQDFSTIFVIPGFHKRITLCESQRPMNKIPLLLLFTMIGFVWPYSMYAESQVVRTKVEYLKQLTL